MLRDFVEYERVCINYIVCAEKANQNVKTILYIYC